MRPGGSARPYIAPHLAPLPAGSLRQLVHVAAELPCHKDPDLFFAEAPDDIRRAKALCGRCPVRSACLAGALQRAEPCGVWGGALFLQGAVIAEKRPRGRPRKADVARAQAEIAWPSAS